jgi:hypothetical protein
MSAIKSCNRCWASYTRERWGELPLVAIDDRDLTDLGRSREQRRCHCGEVLTIERAWLLHDDEPETNDEIDDPTELFLLPDGGILLLWPVGDGSYSARKLSGALLRQAQAQAKAIEGT